MSYTNVACIDDLTHSLTEPALLWLQENQKMKQTLMITSSFICDLLICAVLYKWTVHSKSWRLPMALTGIYLMKVLITNLFFMKVPHQSAWTFPGWYSLSVQYGLSNTTHFCLHVALLIVSMCEFRSMKSRLYFIGYPALIYASIIIIILRGCYVSDLVAAVAFGIWFWYFAELSCYIVDVKVFGLLF
jgi:hypothetical protein